MSIPVHKYPGGDQIQIPTENVTFKWIEPLGGGTLSGPIDYGTSFKSALADLERSSPLGTIRPDGKEAHHGIATVSEQGHTVIEYYYCPYGYQ
ncbi:hypothetical protein QJ856_gp0404 [Tupanvirus deep ocean]|uniref:Uncharacterized protein n=2 Tax=Tupanvirus TaxID=2094720 RepID=A0AC62A9F1_9VIRU|nr:hypothetical protein QJ856_gp0404 [Tupanvirus deep ocean]QKU34339.1 hypothetical protein [Tupanvirus deep ocean]